MITRTGLLSSAELNARIVKKYTDAKRIHVSKQYNAGTNKQG